MKTLLVLLLFISTTYAGELHKLKTKTLGARSGTLYYGQEYLDDLPVGLNFLDTPLYQCIVVVKKDQSSPFASNKVSIISCKIKKDAQKRIDGSRTSKKLNKITPILEV